MINSCSSSKIDINSMCNCSYPTCSRKGLCCECLHYHRQKNELPACYFRPEVEKTYDRSIKRFLSQYR